MTSYSPNPIVKFNDQFTYADNTIADISINLGRGDVIEATQAGYARITLWTPADTPLNVNLSDSVTVTIQSATYGEPTRTNLITNPSIETNTTSWSGTNIGISQSTTFAKYGVDSLKGIVATTGTNRFIDFFNTAVPVTAGQVYTYSCWVYLPTTNTANIPLTLQVHPWRAAGFLSGINLQTQTVTRGSWTRFSGTFTAPATTTSALFRVINTASWVAGQEIYIDGAMLEKTNTLNDYFDGSSTIPIGCAWTGTANLSSSTQTGTDYPIFTGIVSDIDLSISQYGDMGSIAEYSLTAVGPLAQLNKRIAGYTTYPKQKDGDRVYAILSEAFLTQWIDVNPTTAWNALPTGVQWFDYDGVNQDIVNNLATTIDRPGVYELEQYNGGEDNALTLASQAAQSGRGVLFEAGNGHLHYGDYVSRVSSAVVNLTADDLITDGLQSSAQWSEIVNDVTVTYKSSAEKYARNESSIILYGQLAGSRDTILENAADAQTQANDFLASRAFPRVYPESLTVALHNPEVTDDKRDALILAENGTAITTSALPAVFGTSFDGYLEGYTWRLTRYEAYIDLICSAQSETYSSIIWYQLPPTGTWAAYNPTTRWSDL